MHDPNESNEPNTTNGNDQLKGLIHQAADLVSKIGVVVDKLQDHANKGERGPYERRTITKNHSPERRKDG